MALTPLDIHNKEFKRVFRGYDEDEVNEFLDLVIKEFEILIREKKELEEKLAEYEERLNHFNNIEESLSKTIIVAQEAADEVKNNAKKEAELIIREAEKNADRIINEALAKSRNIALEVEELKKASLHFPYSFPQPCWKHNWRFWNNDDWDKLAQDEVTDMEELRATR